MAKADDMKELRSSVAETLKAADDVVNILNEDEGTQIHYFLIRWLVPQALKTLDSLRNGEYMEIDSEQMQPVHALAIVMDHFDYLVQESIDDMDDDEYQQLTRMLEQSQ